MYEILKIALVQFDIAWLNVQKNLEKIEKLVFNADEQTDLIILPEMFSTGFIPDPAVVSSREQELVLECMSKMAARLKSCVAGSHAFNQEGVYFNRFIVAYPDGKYAHYDKRHLFTIGAEKQKYRAGNERITFKVKDWNIMPQVCYDLRFPVWNRNNLKYDLLIYTANWPMARQHAWEILLKARAIENQCYVAGINRIGIDGLSVGYIGRTQVISPKGEIMATLGNTEDLLLVRLSKTELEQFRKDFPVLDDADDFTIIY